MKRFQLTYGQSIAYRAALAQTKRLFGVKYVTVSLMRRAYYGAMFDDFTNLYNWS
jgi:hypothetical protein